MATAVPTFEPTKIAARIEQAARVEAELTAEQAQDVAFHMTDWLGDLSAYVEFCRSPGSYSPEQVNKLLIAFLVHVPNHLAAAAKLYADFPVTDIFNVGAVASSPASEPE